MAITTEALGLAGVLTGEKSLGLLATRRMAAAATQHDTAKDLTRVRLHGVHIIACFLSDLMRGEQRSQLSGCQHSRKKRA
jgi:hypothetical protein